MGDIKVICKICSRAAKKVVFQTFSYFYCEYCKKEVEPDKDDKPKTWYWGVTAEQPIEISPAEVLGLTDWIDLPSDTNDSPPPPDMYLRDKVSCSLRALVKRKAIYDRIKKCYKGQ